MCLCFPVLLGRFPSLRYNLPFLLLLFPHCLSPPSFSSMAHPSFPRPHIIESSSRGPRLRDMGMILSLLVRHVECQSPGYAISVSGSPSSLAYRSLVPSQTSLERTLKSRFLSQFCCFYCDRLA
ncbi:uncharacterized protein BO97DRAFT_107994 [Aspergillus homomorphus CBS 101889]|uniref:Uncharacterized protein n=1 Tax=Aspergillus homomorphus (strain CBS 101889) TaxID=1450537 RepID=A0A395HTW0_ASPHC|nr:hypothetical protein BO97DRAFT_107994 [Aspergillus homomorphus CBS 101889]RAL11247.1 hypothetical protein BO97DRAFT_107994 [Aspergillus homomorphus CBS 101889]